MLRRVVLTRDPVEAALAALDPPWSGAPPSPSGDLPPEHPLHGAVGAWLDFFGVVRATEDDQPLIALDYEAHQKMAQHQLEQLLGRLEARYPLLAVLVVHRLGVVPVGESSLLVRIFSAHRKEALEACASLIDELKTWVPIWKHPVRG